MMKLNIKQMNYEEANQICKWIYDKQYSIYSMEDSDACREEFLSGMYFSATNLENKLIGYYCFGTASQVPAGKEIGVYEEKAFIDIGLGIRSDLCGKTLGFDFFTNGLEYARKQFASKGFRLTVATFNERAIKVYERIGFKKVNSFKRVSENGDTEFCVMTI